MPIIIIDFIFDNTQIQNNVIHAAHIEDINNYYFRVKRNIQISEQPIKEEYLLTGPLEPTNEAYAIYKISGIKLCEIIRNNIKEII